MTTNKSILAVNMSLVDIKKAVQFANHYYYSQPYTVINLGDLPIPIAPALIELKTEDNNDYLVRSSHGLLHVTGAMELIDRIDGFYEKYVPNYVDSLNKIAEKFGITKEDLLDLIKIAVLFHDAGRQGDGKDLWDPESAQICMDYLQLELGIGKRLAQFIADTILHKDDEKAKPNEIKFADKYQEIDPKVDLVRQLVNTADMLEVIRTRDEFKPGFLLISQYCTQKQMIEDIIPNLVVPHRQLIVGEGRLSKEGRIKYPGFTDTNMPKAGKNFSEMAKAYQKKCQTYDIAILEINENNLSEALDRALMGVNDYINKYKNDSGIKLFHNGFFSPRYHGQDGIDRADDYMKRLSNQANESETEDDVIERRVKALYALLSRPEGKTLKEEVLRSFNQNNLKKLYDSLMATATGLKKPIELTEGLNNSSNTLAN